MKKTIFFPVILLSAIFILNACGVAPYFGGTASSFGGIISPVSNPFYELADVQFVSCYGNRSTATVEFVFTVTAHTNVISNGTFGGYGGAKFVARGKTYIPGSLIPSVELVRYYPSDVIISNIRSVPDYLVYFDRVELSWYFDASHHSGKAGQNLIFNNVPIIWQ